MIIDEENVRDQLVTMWRVAEYDHDVTEKAIDLIDTLVERDSARKNAEHYGPYGANCMATGQFDAGECWLCYAKRKKKRVAELEAALLFIRDEAHNLKTAEGIAREALSS